MQVQQTSLWGIARKFYQGIIPASVRTKIYDSPVMQGIRESFDDKDVVLPYILLREEHIANSKVVLNRNALLSQLPKDGIAAEIGVNRGDFSTRIMTYAQPRKLHLIDIWASERYHEGLMDHVENKFAQELSSELMQIHRGYSTDKLLDFEDGYFDWVYIDTDHSYATTAAELELCSRKVKPGTGIIAGHDYITGDWKLRVRYGVVEAVNEFCVNNDWELIYITNETHRHVSYAIRKIQE